MTDLRRQFPAGPAWGEGHLALDAIVAYVDDELSPGARRRALDHLSRCRECAAEVIAQTQARLALRAASTPSLPSSLLSSLRAIPQQAELPAPPAGLAVGPEGELVSESPIMGRAGPRRRPLDRRARLGAGAIVSGLALGALMVSGTPSTGVASGATADARLLRPALDARLELGGTARDIATVVPAPAISGGAVPSSSATSIRRLHQRVR